MIVPVNLPHSAGRGIAISPKQPFVVATCQSERLLQNKGCLS
ncbi:uncharacterized, partial [Tachysurus ichikawai]